MIRVLVLEMGQEDISRDWPYGEESLPPTPPKRKGESREKGEKEEEELLGRSRE